MVDAGAVGLSARLSSAVPSLSLLSPHSPCCPQLYENFVEEIDAIDNGIAQAVGEPRYALSTTLSARVGHLNPRWNDPDQDTEVRTAPAAPGDTSLGDTTDPQCPQAGFRRAMELVGSEFLERLDFYYRAWLPARVLVEEAVRRRFEVTPSQPRGNLEFWGKLGCGEAKSPAFAPHTLCGPCIPARGDSELLGMLSPGRFWESPPHVLPPQVDASGQILELSQGSCPWKEHLFQLEQEMALPRPLQLVLFPDRGGQWRVQSVPIAPHSFQSR